MHKVLVSRHLSWVLRAFFFICECLAFSVLSRDVLNCYTSLLRFGSRCFKFDDTPFLSHGITWDLARKIPFVCVDTWCLFTCPQQSARADFCSTVLKACATSTSTLARGITLTSQQLQGVAGSAVSFFPSLSPISLNWPRPGPARRPIETFQQPASNFASADRDV